MDTRWSGTNEADYFVSPEAPKKGGKIKGWTAFLAFFLGVTLTLSGLGAIGAQIYWERDLTPPLARDWRDTAEFRYEAAGDLRDFLTLGVGGRPDFYSESYWDSAAVYDEAVYEGGWPLWSNTRIVVQSTDASSVSPSSEAAPDTPVDRGREPESGREPKQEPDAAYKQDKNVLYEVHGPGGTYTNTEDGDALRSRKLEGYDFYLTFRDGKVRIFRDGWELEVYGDGVYDNGDAQWFVPGYDNFPVSEQLDGVTVDMAVRTTPIRYYSQDYETGGSYHGGSMYYIAQRWERVRAFYRTQAMVCGAGVLCLAVWFVLRKSRRVADNKIASWTVHVWTEVRAALGIFLAVLVVAGADWGSVYYRLRDIWWSYEGRFWNGEVLLALLGLVLSCFPALLALGWFSWLIRNDHRHNPKEARRSLLRPFLRGLRAKDLKRPVEKRLSRTMASGTLALLLLAIAGAAVWCTTVYHVFFDYGLGNIILDGETIYLRLPLMILSVPVFLALIRSWRSRDLAKDVAALADQVEAVRAGDLSKPLDLPQDADLRRTADALNDIQSGMRTALAEQTRSERMKVELVSNVSHDLKTPLTSILSYAELLRQEDLPPAAADYARVIDEKAQRLKAMVQDVFEISRASSDQLPVQLERLDFAKLLRQTLADMDEQIRHSALTFKLDVPEGEVTIVADGKRLYRVFQNLIDNALKYALAGSRVYLSLTAGDREASASLRNTSRDELPEGVDFTARFVRGDESRTDGGSGLGLSIAKSFTEACGGSFRVETVADLFTAVVTFPLAGKE